MRIPLLLLSLIILGACKAQDNNMDLPPPYVDSSKNFTTDLPKISYGYNPNYRAHQLGLDQLDFGFNNLQIRIWYEHSLTRIRQLVVIKNIDSTWKATVYKMLINSNGGKLAPTLDSRSIDLVPKSGWKSFMRNLMDLNIMTLPDCTQIKDYHFGDDGTTYIVEIATKKRHTYYSYWEPEWANKEFWQAKNMGDIITLLEKELSVSKQFREFHP